MEKEKERTGRGQTDGWREAEEQSHRFKLKSGNTREGETFAGLSGLITPGTGSIWNYERCWCWWWWWWWLVAHSISASSSPPFSIFFLLALSDEKIILIVCPIHFSFSKIFRSKICIRGSNNVRSLSIFISLVLLNSRFDDNWKAGELAINSYGLIYAKRAITIHRDRGWYYSPARKLQSVFSGFESLFFFFLFSLLFFAPPPPLPILSTRAFRSRQFTYIPDATIIERNVEINETRIEKGKPNFRFVELIRSKLHREILEQLLFLR